MRFDPRIKSIALGLLGGACMLAYLWLFAHTRIAEFLRPSFSQDEIIAKAGKAFQQSPLAEFGLRREVSVNVNNDLAKFVQRSQLSDSAVATLSLGYWEIGWSGEISTENEKREKAVFKTRYDFSGKFTGMELIDPRKKNVSSMNQAQALTCARAFLTELTIDTSAFMLSEKKSIESNDIQLQQFSFTRLLAFSSVLREKVDVHVADNNVIYFRADTKVQDGTKATSDQTQKVVNGKATTTSDENKLFESQTEKTANIVVVVSTALTWAVIIVFLVVLFFKRLRHNELEFKRVWWFAGLMMLAVFANVAVRTWGTDWAGVFLGGGIGGLFAGLGMIITYAMGDRIAREAWPEKLVTTDLLFSGRLRIKEIGEAILLAFFVAGVTVLVLGLVVALTNAFHLSFLSFADNRLWFLGEPIELFIVLNKNVAAVTYVAALVPLFWAAYLKSRMQKVGLAFVLLIVTLNFSSIHLDNFDPRYISIFLMLPAAILWAYFTHKYDFLTIWLALLLFSVLLELGFIGIAPEILGTTLLTILFVLTLMFFGVGVLLVYQRKSAREFGGYLPAYVSRIIYAPQTQSSFFRQSGWSLVGPTLNHYQIEEKLGEGGVGVVYKALDLKLNRTVALKFLKPDLTHHHEVIDRFINEAQAASALDHPNICTVYEINETGDGQMFICMAYYSGETLQEKLRLGALPFAEALNLGTQISKGLGKAHEAGIFHRDIKPSNLMITPQSEIKIIDWGIAKLAGKTRLTKTRTTPGTVAYMSPEQVRGKMLDHRTDIWSLGVVLYEMLSGQPPFPGENEAAVIYSIVHEKPVALMRYREGISSRLQDIVVKTLEKNLRKRYQQVGEVLADLNEVKEELR